MTSHKKGEEYGAGDMMNNVLSLGYTIREHRHNHPSNSSIPSGMYKGDKQGDIFFAKNLDKVAKKNNAPPFILSIRKTLGHIHVIHNTLHFPILDVEKMESG